MNVFEPFLFDALGYAVVKDVLTASEVAEVNGAIDGLDVWTRVAPLLAAHTESRWSKNDDPVVRYACPIDHDHVQIAPVTSWPAPLGDLVYKPRMQEAIAQVFPGGAYVDHATMSIARPGSAGIELHGGGFDRDPRQYYRSDATGWSVGLTIFALTLVATESGHGGTALVPGSHTAALGPAMRLPPPDDFHAHDWITGATLAPGDLLVFSEALMHGAYPWLHAWERRCLIVKVYPSHLANLHARLRGAEEPFWR